MAAERHVGGGLPVFLGRRKTGFLPIYYMDVGDLILQALLSMLLGALVYLWFLKAFIVPVGSNVFDIGINSDYNIDEVSPSKVE